MSLVCGCRTEHGKACADTAPGPPDGGGCERESAERQTPEGAGAQEGARRTAETGGAEYRRGIRRRTGS